MCLFQTTTQTDSITVEPPPQKKNSVLIFNERFVASRHSRYKRILDVEKKARLFHVFSVLFFKKTFRSYDVGGVRGARCFRRCGRWSWFSKPAVLVKISWGGATGRNNSIDPCIPRPWSRCTRKHTSCRKRMALFRRFGVNASSTGNPFFYIFT